MAHDEFNSGVRHGFNMAKLAVRNVDKQIRKKLILKLHIKKDY